MPGKTSSPQIGQFIKKLYKFPFYPIFFSLFPVLTMFSGNLTETEKWMIIRPVLVSLVVMILVFCVSYAIFRSVNKASAFTLVSLVIFFTYGQIYNLDTTNSSFLSVILRHRYMIAFSLAVLVVTVILLFRRKVDALNIPLNLITLVLIILPLVNILSYNTRTDLANRQQLTVSSSDVAALDLTLPADPPDIYYIILDTYTRQDVIQNRFGYDNSAFMDALKEEGFYIGDCSRSNFAQTLLSLNSSLNMSYIPNIQPVLESIPELTATLNNNIVYTNLRKIGYELITFDTNFQEGNILNTDVYLSGQKDNPLEKYFEGLQSFEMMFYDSTAFKLVFEYQDRLPQSVRDFMNAPYSKMRQAIFYELDKMKDLPASSKPVMVHTHIVSPHPPAKFDSNGDPVNGQKYFSLNADLTSKRTFGRNAYVEEVQYLNKKVLGIVKDIKEKAKRPVVIIIQGDHGTFGFGAGDKFDRIKILNAYYFSDQDYSALYKNITPVNSFRVILDKYFQANLPLLKGETFYSKYEDRFQFEQLKENYPACMQ